MLGKLKKAYRIGKQVLTDKYHQKTQLLNELEASKPISRTEVINCLINTFNKPVKYLEIGVRNPEDNFNRIICEEKYSVDPGIEFEDNPVDFKLTSDDFFAQLEKGAILYKEIRFDVIFIDGLHLAEQVDRDIENALLYLEEEGFLVLHDCNPPSEWNAREEHNYFLSPARRQWNGTTWKAFVKWRKSSDLFSACIDSDWGIGIFSKGKNIGEPTEIDTEFYEFKTFDKNRKQLLNLISFSDFKLKLKENT